MKSIRPQFSDSAPSNQPQEATTFKKVQNALEMGVLCALAGWAVVYFISGGSDGGIVSNFSTLAPASSFLTGTFLWYFRVVKSNAYRSDRGFTTGVIISIVSQFLLWYMQMSKNLIRYYLTRGCTNSFGEPPPDFFSSLFLSAGMSLVGLAFLGWCTIPLGGVLGWVIAEWQVQRSRKILRTSQGAGTL